MFPSASTSSPWLACWPSPPQGARKLPAPPMETHRTDWFKRAGWGVFTHYLTGPDTSAEDWSRRVSAFDVPALARQLETTGCRYRDVEQWSLGRIRVRLVGLRIAIVVIALILRGNVHVSPEIPGFHGLHVARELRVLAFLPAHGELGTGDRQAIPSQLPAAKGDGGQHKRRVPR